MPKVRIVFTQQVNYDQDVEMSQEDYDVLKDVEEDIQRISKEGVLLEKYVDFSEVLDVGNALTDVYIELVKSKNKR